ncbi:hypothetical protein Taro_007472 [Colocasia esculenta]|uniref:Uncharacterized protein n=1 Tax=Colocasia esculenta TaxID=4460 RepID=A0A843U0G5_COLES|nr:hypothetical protein [Colocasia esculenta]
MAQQCTVSTSVNVLRARHKTAQADGKTLVWTTHTSHNSASTSQWSGAPTGVLPLDQESRSPLPSKRGSENGLAGPHRDTPNSADPDQLSELIK